MFRSDREEFDSPADYLRRQLDSGQLEWLTNIAREGGYFDGDDEEYVAQLIKQVGDDHVVIDDAMGEDGPADIPFRLGVYLKVDPPSNS